MAKALRIHNLAKELGVPSKEILAKCKAEGIELKNHMATVSAGLAESIREWFSPEADTTSVESAPVVDLEAVRAKVKPRKTKQSHADDEGDGDSAVGVALEESEPDAVDGAVAGVSADAPAEVVSEDVTADLAAEVVEAAAETPVAADEAPAAEVAVEVDSAAPVAPVAPVSEAAGDVEAPSEIAAVDPAAAAPEAEIAAPVAKAESETPAEPAKPVSPAGPQVVPQKAELKGPRVVRIEAPDDPRPPRPRPARPGGGFGGGPGGSPGGGFGDSSRPGSGGPSGFRRGPAGRGRGRTTQDDDANRRRAAQGDAKSEAEAKLREWRDQDLIERQERLRSATGTGVGRRRAEERRRQEARTRPGTVARKREVEIQTPIMLKDFCAAIGVPFQQIMRKIMEHKGQMMMINQMIDHELAEMIALDFDVQVTIAQQKSELEKLVDEFAERERKSPMPRPPIVAMLGHVDHGKTSLLDAIRRTDVASGEAGGITQHIGASRIERDGVSVTFLDTPGHEAFTAMRARGAHMTDVVVLVVAADDGVMPQTAEAINHVKAAGVQIVVAMNKIDLPGADPNRVYTQLSEHELIPSEWGGSTDVIKTSATTGEGVDELLEHLTTLTDLLELRADQTIPAVGTVIEASRREGQGNVAQVLVQEGTLKVGQVAVCGPAFGRVRSLMDHRGKRVKEARPGTPVAVVGLDELPIAGDKLYVVGDNNRAKGIAAEVKEERRVEALTPVAKPKTLEALLSSAGEEEVPVLNVIVKADVQGSVETIRAQLEDFPSDKAQLRILHTAVGAISEADVALAQASSAIVFGFNVIADDRAQAEAERQGVEVRSYRVIYEMLEDIHKALEGLLAPLEQEEKRGTAEVRQVFNVSRVGTIAGCYVTDGLVARNHKVRLIRDGTIVTEGHELDSLKRFKDDAKEVKSGFECGIKIAGYNDVKPGDRIEAYEVVEVAQQL